MKSVFAIVSLILGIILSPAMAAIINVPADQPSIQAGINAAVAGDTVLVAPGTYFENINFNGKPILVTSSAGPTTTIIDGARLGPVVTFSTGETLASMLSGFTLQNGQSNTASQDAGGGIFIYFASPTIRNNHIFENVACVAGGGIEIAFGDPLITQNKIANNSQSGCSEGAGAGIGVIGTAPQPGVLQIINNIILDNVATGGFGGGIYMFQPGKFILQNNVIAENVASGASPSQGGGVYINAEEAVNIVQNVVYGNTADQGAGLYVGFGTTSILANNTVANNNSTLNGSALFVTGVDNLASITNNLLIGADGQNAVYCDAIVSQPPIFTANDAYALNGTGMQGTCSLEARMRRNIALNPMFVNGDADNYQLQVGSPAIDAGTNRVRPLPKADIAGQPRIVDGNGDGIERIDMGSYEFQ